MNCYFACQKLSKTCFTTTKETALAPLNLAHPVRNALVIIHAPLGEKTPTMQRPCMC